MFRKFFCYTFIICLLLLTQNNIYAQGKRNIGIFPFENQSGKSNDWIGFGLEYLLENKLSGIAAFYVPSQKIIKDALKKRNWQGSKYNADAVYQVGRETGINAGVVASYELKGQRLSVRVKIYNAFSGQVIADEKYENSLSNIFDLADHIVDLLVERSGITLNEKEKTIARRKITNSVKAFEFFCLGYIENENPKSRPESITALFRRAINEDKNFWEAYYNLGIVYFNIKDYDRALQQFDIIINALPNFEKPYYGRGLIYFRKNKFNEAESDFERVVEFNPNDHKAYLYLGKINIELNKFKEALNHLNKVVEINPDYAPAYYEMGNVWFSQNKYDRAIPQFKKATELDPENYDAHQKLGESYYRQQVYYSAIGEFQKILDNDANNALANFMMGITLYKQAVLNDLIEAFLELLQTPSSNTAQQETGGLQQTELYEKMADHFMRAHIARSNFIEATFNLALTYHEMGRYTEAIEYFNKSINMDPNLIKAYIKKAHTYELMDQKDKALDVYKTVVSIEPAYFVREPTLGPVHQYINIFDVVFEEIEDKLDGNPNDVEANKTLGKIYYAQGYYGKAANLFRKVLSVDPSNKEAKAMLAKLEKR